MAHRSTWIAPLLLAVGILGSLPMRRLSAQEPGAQPSLRGIVVEAGSGRPVADARITLPSRALETRTDEDGAFELTEVPVGTHVVLVSLFGYLDLTRAIAVGSAGADVRLELDPSPFGLEGLTVTVDGEGAMTGHVVDAVSRDPVADVVVWLPTLERGVAADSLGRFAVPGVPYGPQVVQVRRAGYAPRMVPTTFAPGWDPIEIALEPDRGVLANLPAVSKRLRGRRNQFQGIVTVHDTERMTLKGVRDVRDYLFKYTLVHVVPCTGMAKSFWCVDHRGTPVEPQVCIDGWIEWGGIDLLQRMGPDDLYMVEIYGTTGLLIRAYTHDYIEALARGAQGVTAAEPTPQREGVEGLGWASGRSDAQVPLGPRC